MRKLERNNFSDRLLGKAPGFFRRWLLPGLFIMLIQHPAMAQGNKPVPDFDVLGRQPFEGKRQGVLGGGANNKVATFKLEYQNGKHRYAISAQNAAVSIDALSNIEYVGKADRIVTYGDSLHKHVASNAYARLYTGTGTLVKSLGLVATWPFTASLSDNGSFVIAGNKSKPGDAVSMALSLYDKNGNLQWQKAVPDLVPVNVFVDENYRYIALVLYDPARLSGSIQYYNASGSLLFTDNDHTAVSGIEFLPSKKAVVCTGNMWYLYDLSPSYKLVTSGVLQGNTVGRFPVSAHPSKDIFLIVTTNGTAGYRLQAFNASDGTLLAESQFEGEPSWQSFRLANISADGTIQLITSREVVTLKMR